jgi:BirA family biotin operon repressor/biotin-[acetyl-CoA-carboxylase] ligase
VNQLSDFTTWPVHLKGIVGDLSHFEEVQVLAQTESTQDVARREEAGLGTVVLAGRQTGGRGRRGSSWTDDLGCGVSMTLVLPIEDPAAACARGAVAMANALVPLMEEHAVCAGIKWPNDLVAMIGGPRKIGGILIEVTEGVALAGIGVNVLPREWPEDLAGSAATLEDAGVHIERIEVIELLLRAWDRALGLPVEELRAGFAEFDVLKGARARFEEAGAIHEGIVRAVDPLGGIVLKTLDGISRLGRERTRLLSWEPRDLLSQ